MIQDIPPIFVEDATVLIEVLPDMLEKIVCVNRYGSNSGVYRIFFVSEKTFDFSLPKIIKKCYSSLSRKGDRNYALAFDRSEFSSYLMKYFKEIHDTIMEITEIDPLSIFDQEPVKAYKEGYYLGFKLVPTQVEVESAMGEYLTDEKERQRFTRRVMSSFKVLYPFAMIYKDFIAKWTLFSTKENDSLLMDRKSLADSGITVELESLVDLYLDFLPYRKFASNVKGGIIEISKLMIPESPILLQFSGPGITELSMTEEGLKSLLLAYFHQFDIPEELQPSLSGKFHVSRLASDCFLVCNDVNKAIYQMRQKLGNFSNFIQKGDLGKKMNDMVFKPILHTMDLRQHMIVDLQIDFT